jgi:flagellar M-ring protein FliF
MSKPKWRRRSFRILEPAVGVGKVKPQVSVSMNFQQVEETQENYDPQKAVIVSAQRQSDTTTGATPVGGVVGVRPPPPPAVPAPGATVATETAKPSTSGKSSEVVNYEISKSIRHIVNPVGKIERVSVCPLFLDNQTETTTATDGKVSVKSTPRTPEEMKKYHDLVAAAIAFDMERGDQLIVENISFDSENTPETIAEPTFLEKQTPTILTALRYIIIPIAFVLIYFLFIRPFRSPSWPAGFP